MGEDIFGPPDEYLCPITRDLMENPVVAADGFTYERSAITLWLEKGHNKSPMTNERLLHKLLTPNYVLRRMIDKFKSELPLSQKNNQAKIKEASKFKEEIMKLAIDINNGRIQRFEHALNEEKVNMKNLEIKLEELSQRISIDTEQISDTIKTQQNLENVRGYSVIFKLIENRWFRLYVDSYDSVAQVKTKIFNKRGIPEARQRLIFNGIELVDDLPMCEYNIKDDAEICIHLTSSSFQNENYLIYIKNLRGKHYEFMVNSGNTIKSLKLMIQDIEGTKVESQRLIFAGKLLDDELSFSDYNILNGSTIHLVLVLKGC